MGSIVTVGGNIVKGLWQGIQSLASWLWNKVSGWISGIWTGIKDFFGIKSPSKQMGWVGEMLVKGLAGSIEDNGDEAVKAAEAMSDDINGVMKGLADDMQSGLSTDFSVNGTASVNGTSGGLAAVVALLEKYLPQMGNYQLVADTGAVVGWLAPVMDDALGTMQRRKERFL